MRLKPETKNLLVKAKEDQRRSISSLIDESVRNQLGYRYGTLDGLKTDAEAQAWAIGLFIHCLPLRLLRIGHG